MSAQLFDALMDLARTKTITFSPRSDAGAPGHRVSIVVPMGSIEQAGYGSTPEAALTDLIARIAEQRLT